MKTRFTEVALAALPALVVTQAAMAQAPAGQVQMYGSLTAAAIYKDNQTGGGSVKELANSLLAASHLGLRGTEDLGGGMSAVFRLETGISTDTGLSGGTVAGTSKFWNRQSFVGLNLRHGVTLTAGRQFHAATDRTIRSLDVFNVGGTSLHVTPLALHGTNRFAGNDGRTDDSIKLRVTGPAGLQGGVSGALNDGAGRSYSLDLAQVTPNYTVGVTASKYESPNIIAANGVRPEYMLWGIGGNVRFGPVTLFLHYIDAELDATVANRPSQDNRVVHLGVNWQAAPLVVVKAGLYDDKGKAMNNVVGRNGKKETVVLSAEYLLSKRTSLQAVAFSNRFSGGYKLDPVNIAGLGRDPNASSTQGYSLGVRHDF